MNKPWDNAGSPKGLGHVNDDVALTAQILFDICTGAGFGLEVGYEDVQSSKEGAILLIRGEPPPHESCFCGSMQGTEIRRDRHRYTLKKQAQYHAAALLSVDLRRMKPWLRTSI